MPSTAICSTTPSISISVFCIESDVRNEKSTRRSPGAFALVGIRNEKLGTGATHHSAEFEVDPDALKYGTAASVAYALGFLNSDLHIQKQWKSFSDLYDSLGLPEEQISYLRGLRDDYDSV